MRNPQILLVDLNKSWCQSTAVALSKAGYVVQTAASLQQALHVITQFHLPDLMVMSIARDMPEYTFAFCKNMHTFCDVPIVLVADRYDSDLFVRALNGYAEDIVVDSQAPGILVARIKRILIRFTSIDQRTLNIDWPRRQLWVEDTRVNLSPTESRLLHLFLRRQNKVVDNEYIMRRLWPKMMTGSTTVRTAVHRLRGKLAHAFGQDCITCHQGGYRLQTRVTNLIGMSTD